MDFSNRNNSIRIYFYLLLLLIYIEYVRALPALKEVDIWSDHVKNELGHFGANRSVEELKNFTGIDRYPRVLNFFPVPVEEECLSTDGRRKGTCLNAYECRIKNGASKGPCALGFGVCCVFTATCKQEASNNITYFVNPDFPDLSRQMFECSLTVKKMDPEIAQLRLDFIHFNLGQPNRQTGICEDDIFLITIEGGKELKLCGLNSGQHAYFDIETVNDPIQITMNLSRKIVSRLWEVQIIQVPFVQRAPSGCLQYHTGATGVIQTMNFADNGRHLAEQDYNICIRQETNMCSIAYEPCDENSFKISPNNNSSATQEAEEGSGAGDEAEARKMMICNDRIVLPCDSDDLLLIRQDDNFMSGVCDMIHCGDSLCPFGDTPCRIESSVTPFTVGVHFGPSARDASPDDNLGMCITYEQLPCYE